MANGYSTEIEVTRKVRDGWFVYSCDVLPGLFVASQDDRAAYNDLPTAIRKLMKLDYGIDCVVTHKVPYADFIVPDIMAGKARDAVRDRTDELMAETATFAFALCAASDGDGASSTS